MCAREGCDCDSGGLDALEGRMWPARGMEFCIIHDRALEDGQCLGCNAERPSL